MGQERVQEAFLGLPDARPGTGDLMSILLPLTGVSKSG